VNCHDIQEMTVPYLELDLSPSAVRQVTDHLEDCETCRVDMEAVRQVLVRVKGRTVPDPGEAFWQAFPEQVRHGLGRGSSAGMLYAVRWPLALAASLALLMGAWLFAGIWDWGGRSDQFAGASKSSSASKHIAQQDEPDLADMDWEREWDDEDPDIVLATMARRLDRATVDRLFRGI